MKEYIGPKSIRAICKLINQKIVQLSSRVTVLETDDYTKVELTPTDDSLFTVIKALAERSAHIVHLYIYGQLLVDTDEQIVLFNIPTDFRPKTQTGTFYIPGIFYRGSVKSNTTIVTYAAIRDGTVRVGNGVAGDYVMIDTTYIC